MIVKITIHPLVAPGGRQKVTGRIFAYPVLVLRMLFTKFVVTVFAWRCRGLVTIFCRADLQIHGLCREQTKPRGGSFSVTRREMMLWEFGRKHLLHLHEQDRTSER